MRLPLTDADLRGILDNVSDVVIVQTIDAQLVYVSPSMTAMFGWSPAELVGRPSSELWQTDDVTQEKALRQVLGGSEIARVRLRMRCKDGSTRWVELTGRAISDEYGNPLGVVCVARDVDLLVKAEQSLLSSAQRYRMLADYANDVVFQTDANQRITWVSASVTRSLGWQAGMLTGMELPDLLHPSDRDQMARYNGTLFDPHTPSGTTSPIFARFRSQFGAYTWMSGVTTVVDDQIESGRYAVTGVHDVQDLVVERDRSTASESRLQAILDSLQDALVILEPMRDDSGEIVDFTYGQVNQRACRIDGLQKDELLGRRLLDLHPSMTSTGLLDAYIKVMESGEPLDIDDMTYPGERGGPTRRYKIRAIRLGDSLCQTWRDVTERFAWLDSLAQAEARYRLLAENAADIIAMQTMDGVLTWISPTVTDLTGWTPDELVGAKPDDFLHPDDLHRLADARNSDTGELHSSFEGRFRTASGEYRWLSLAERSIHDSADHVVSKVSSWRDVTAEHEAVAALEESEERFRLALTNSTIGMALVSPEGRFMTVNTSLCAMLGRDEVSLTSVTWQELTHPDDLKVDEDLVDEVLTGTRDSYRLLKRFVRPDGAIVWGDLSVSCVRGEHRDVRYFISQIVDVTEQVEARHRIEESERRYRLLAENAMDLVLALDMHAYIQWVSPSVEQLLGYQPEELTSKFAAMLLHPDDLHLLLEAAAGARTGHSETCRVRMRTKAGVDRWVEATPRGVYDEQHTLIGGVIGVRDIHREVLAQEALQQEVDFDALTGLAKRNLAVKRIQEILDTRSTPGWALLYLGVNGMTAINQAYTYLAGDEVLKAVADRLVKAAGARDRVARATGDEFVILLRDIESPSSAAGAAEKLLDAIKGPVDFNGQSLEVTGCIGIAMANEHHADDLLRDASAAMRQAAAKGRGFWEFIDRNVGEETRQSLSLQAALRRAIDNDNLHAWFMPIASIHDGSVVGYEALIRWVDSGNLISSPVEFLEVAEQTGLILTIDRVILSKAINAMSALPRDRHVAVNISAATLASGSLTSWIHEELDRSGSDPTRLHLEVTETDLFQVTDRVRETMRGLAALGISWWVDDFGTGFSSLSHLRDLPISGLKLDRSFTSGLAATENYATRLAQGLAGLALGLDLRTIAEGVETDEQAKILADQGWQMGQGWLYGKAEPLVVTNLTAGAPSG